MTNELSLRPSPASAHFMWGLTGALLLVCLLLRLPALDVSLWLDEAGSLHQASAHEFWPAARQDVHPPFYYLLLRGQLALTSSIPLLRLLPVACGVALSLVAAWSCRFSRPAAITAGILAAASPELVLHSVQLRPYALLVLLLGLALILAGRIAQGFSGPAARPAASLVLLAAAFTHLSTLFFLIALVPLLAWTSRQAGIKKLLASLWPLAPALLLLLWLKFAFITQPNDLPEGWWLPSLSLASARSALAQAVGWDNVQWLADTVARKSMLSAWLVLVPAAVLAGAGVVAAWRPRADYLSWLLLASALLYWIALGAYSLLFESIVLARTILPGLLPFFAWLAWGIGHQPNRVWRTAAVTATIGYTALATVMPVRLLQTPHPGLRGMAGALRTDCQAGDLIICVHGLETSLEIYWPKLRQNRLLRIDSARPLPAQLDSLEQSLKDTPPSAHVWLVYRDDFYFQRDLAFYEIVRARIRERGGLGPHWQSDDLVLLRTGPAPVTRP